MIFSVGRTATSRLSRYAMAITVAMIIFILATGFPQGPIFWHLLAIHDMPAAWLMLGILLLGHWYGKQCSGEAGWVESFLSALDRQRYAVAVILWLVLCVGSLWAYRNHPLSMDEYAAVFQAKIFAAGALHGQFPPEFLDDLIPRNFQFGFLLVNRETGAVLSAYWPGFSLLLTPFMWLGIPWACNPTLVVASFLLIGRIARDLSTSEYVVGWALLFALASPAFVANGITYYSMPAHLLFNLGFAWLLLTPSPLRLFLAGVTGGFALVLHQPFPHAVFALPWIIWLATRHRQFLHNMLFLALGYLPVFLLLGLGWWLWRQDLLREGLQASIAAHTVSQLPFDLFERVWGLLRGFASLLNWPDDGIMLARAGGLTKLWLWASPLLLLLAWWGARGNKTPAIRLFGASALLTFFAYFLIRFDQGHGWGYRYFHSAWGVLPVLAALGVIKLAETDKHRVFRQVAMLTLVSLAGANTLRFVQMDNFMGGHLAQFPPRVKTEQAIVLHNGRGYYALDLIQNDPWLRGDQIILLSRTVADAEKIRKYFPAAREISANRYGVTMVDAGTGQ